MEIDVWTGTELESSKWDDSSRQWTVALSRKMQDGTENRKKARSHHTLLTDFHSGTLHPKHIIQATGLAGEPHLPLELPGLDSFQGAPLIHSSQFDKPAPNGTGELAVVVGSSNSAHDIAREYYNNGYQTTMVQRSSTYVVSSDTLVDVLLDGLYAENGIQPVEDADVVNFSIPHPVLKRLHISATAEMARRDQQMLKALSEVGFAVDSGPDGSGLWIKLLSRARDYGDGTGSDYLFHHSCCPASRNSYMDCSESGPRRLCTLLDIFSSLWHRRLPRTNFLQTIVGAIFGIWVACGLIIVQLHYGWGRHQDCLSEWHLIEFTKYDFGEWIQTFQTLMFTKLSICFFLLRIPVEKKYIRSIPGMVIFLIITNIVLTLVWIFQCNPVSGAWNSTVPAKCFTYAQLERIIISQAIISIISDFVLALFPIVLLWKIQISFNLKVGLCGLMGLGLV